MIEQHPEIEALDEQRRQIEADRQAYLSWHGQQVAEHQAALTAHRVAVDEAITAGQPVKSKPPPLDESDHHQRVAALHAREVTLSEERTRVVAGLTPQVQEHAQARLAELMKEVTSWLGCAPRSTSSGRRSSPAQPRPPAWTARTRRKVRLDWSRSSP